MTQFQKSNLCGSEKKGEKNQGLQIYKTVNTWKWEEMGDLIYRGVQND